MSNFEMFGMDEMLKELEQKGKNIEQIKEKALTKGAEIIKKQMENNLPVSGDMRHIKDHIVISELKNEGMVGEDYVLVGQSAENNNEFFYGRILEYGSVKMSPRPWAENAVLETKNEVIKTIADEIKEELD